MSDYYSDEDIQQILKQASLLQQDAISQEQLLEIASEVGISVEALRQAEQVLRQQQQVKQRQLVRRSRHRLGFKIHLISYLAVNVLLILINFATTPRYFWSIFPIFGWGLGVAIHGLIVYRNSD